MQGFVPYLKKHLKVAVHLSNESKNANTTHQISVASDALSDKDLAYVSRVIQDKNLQVALGGLLYSFSEDYTETQSRHNTDNDDTQPVLQRFKKLTNALKNLSLISKVLRDLSWLPLNLGFKF